ncbi:MAG: hypothetical protein ACX931_04855 [Saccharospirillum sp.]
MGAFNTTTLAVLAVTLISAMVIGMLIMQNRHRQMAAIRDRLHALSTQYRKLNNTLRTLPSSYLTPELKDFLYQALLQNLHAQLKLNPDQKSLLQSDIDMLSAERVATRNKGSTVLVPGPTSADEASVHRQTLKALHLFIRRNYDAGRLDAGSAEKLLHQVEYKLVDTAVDFFRQRGEQTEKARNYREARIAYQKALDAIQTSKQAALFKQEEIGIRKRLDDVVRKWRAQRAQLSQGHAAKLAEDMGSLIEDQESWKKKNVYD